MWSLLSAQQALHCVLKCVWSAGCSGVADYFWYGKLSKQVGCMSLTVLSGNESFQYALCWPLFVFFWESHYNCICIFGCLRNTNAKLFCRVKESSFFNKGIAVTLFDRNLPRKVHLPDCITYHLGL